MEMILALVVVIAVIIFGALISMGNERQRRAIDGLRERVVSWAIQDLQIKRDALVSDVKIDDPISWLNKVITKTVGYNLDLHYEGFYDSPLALVCAYGNRGCKVVLSPLSPREIHRLEERKTRLSKFSENNPVYLIRKSTAVYDMSILNAGFLFHLELQSVWTSLTGQNNENMNRLWLYLLE